MGLKSNNNVLPKPANHLLVDEDERTLPLTFNVLSLCGVWLPLRWESRKSYKIAYQIFTTFAVSGIFLIMALQTTLIACSDFDVNFLVDVMFTFLTGLLACFKMTNFLVRRKQVIELRTMLMKDCCMPKDFREREMQEKNVKFIRNVTIGFNVASQVTLLIYLITPFYQDTASRKLPFGLWLPYDLHFGPNYWITYALEMVPMIIAILVNATTDVVVTGFVLQACNQLDILKHRLHHLPNVTKFKSIKGLPINGFKEKSLEQFVEHHCFIIEFAKKVTTTFDVVIVELYAVSVLLFSVIVYQLTLGDIPPIQRFMSICYIILMTGELFAYCWCGNEITLKSLELGDEIFKIDWTALSKDTSKMLRFIMLRTSKPIVMSYGNLIVINMDSFKAIMKVTYSAFNVLKKSST